MINPQRKIDAASLKALAHPLRVDLFDALVVGGSATASQLAEQLGESSGATSYHLRQLARHGYIEDDPEQSGGRERWWRVVPGGLTLDSPELHEGSATREAALLVSRQFLDQRARRVDAFVRQGEAELGTDWMGAAMLMATTASLTPEETRTLGDTLATVVQEFLEPLQGRQDPPEARRVATHVNVFPVTGLEGGQ
ncbi:helix-turn-helix domain-containing protein [Demequina sp. B12]|uniref:ArsR/SmtB family transcription factor n=1 Tax=Demequina sp. B12 TaxID=2992757 RepID=UPI00237A26FD|nr:helix-turn-helix domain-containing protein [Demequina sp. B12]MDE0573415.1 helix-turn-helix domain-containing protein [Demequina sp. B12]